MDELGHECRGESAGRIESAGHGSVGERQGRQPGSSNALGPVDGIPVFWWADELLGATIEERA